MARYEYTDESRRSSVNRLREERARQEYERMQRENTQRRDDDDFRDRERRRDAESRDTRAREEAERRRREQEENSAYVAPPGYDADSYNFDADARRFEEDAARQRFEDEERRRRDDNDRRRRDEEDRRRRDEDRRRDDERRRENENRRREDERRRREDSERRRNNHGSSPLPPSPSPSNPPTPLPRNTNPTPTPSPYGSGSGSSSTRTNTPAPTSPSTPTSPKPYGSTPAPTPAPQPDRHRDNYNAAEARRSQDFNRDAEEYRKRLDKQAADEIKRRSSASRGQAIKQDIIKPIESMATRELRSTISHDVVGREARSGYLLGSTVANVAVGMAMMVASCASEAAYSAKILHAQESAAKDYEKAYKSIYKAAEDGYKATLGEYSKQVESTRERLESTRSDSFASYKAAKDQATSTMSQIESSYQKDKAALSREAERSDKRYAAERGAYNATKAQAQTTRDENVAKATQTFKQAEAGARSTYQKDVERIKAEVPANKQADEIRKAAQRRDTTISNANIALRNETQRYDAQRDSTIAAAKTKRDAAAQTHNTEIQSIKDKTLALTAKRDSGLQQQQQAIDTAKAAYSKDVAKAKNNLSNAEMKLSNFQEMGTDRFIRSAEQGAAKFTQKNDKVALSTGASNFAHIVNANHRNVGNEVAMQFASDSEKAVLNRVTADKQAAAKAARDGVPHTRLASDADYKAAKAINAKYAGDISSTEGIKKTLTNLQKSSNILSKECDSLEKNIKSLNKDIKKVDNQLNGVRQQLTQVNADRQALKIGRDAKGNVLTNDQRAAIKARLDSTDVAKLKGQLADLSKQKTAATKTLMNAKDNLAGKQRAFNAIGQHMNFLSKNGAVVADVCSLASKVTTMNVLTKAGRHNLSEISSHKGELKERKNNAVSNKAAAKAQIKDIRAQVKGGQLSKKEAKSQLKDAKAAKKLAKLNKKEIKQQLWRTGILGTAYTNFRVKQASAKVKRDVGRSKKANKMAKQGEKKIMSSIKKVKKEFDKRIHKGNAIHDEIFGNMRKAMIAGQKYNLAVNIATKAVFFVPNLSKTLMNVSVRRLGLQNTRLGQKIAAFKQNHMKALSRLTKGKNMVGKLAGGVLRAPGTILMAPMKLKELPMKAVSGVLKGTFRVGRKVTGTVVGGTARLGGKALKGTARLAGRGIKAGWNKTIGKTKWYQRKVARHNALKQRFKEFKKKIGDKINPVGRFFKKIGSKIWGIISSIISAIGTVISWIIGFVAGILGASLGLIIIIIIIIVIVSLLMSVLAAIWEFLKSLTADYQSYVKHDPEFIMNHAINYRNEELEILELFEDSYGKYEVMEASRAPVFYALYDDTWDWFGLKDTTVNLVAQNTQSLNQYKALVTGHGLEWDKWANPFKQNAYYAGNSFNYELSRYRTTKIKYYMYDRLAKNGSGNWVIYDWFCEGCRKPHNSADKKCPTCHKTSKAAASNYEISNARDALALVDTLYTEKPDMQKVEALAYIGVGEWQAGTSSGEGRQSTNPNLFWATHEFVYKEGVNDGDVWFHVTNKTYAEPQYVESIGRYELLYYVNGGYRYAGSGQEAAPPMATGSYECTCKDWYYFDADETITTSYPKITSNISSTVASNLKQTSWTSTKNAQKIWDALYAEFGNAYAVAGIMGNLYAESGWITNNVEGAFETPLGVTDTTYTSYINGLLSSKSSADTAYKTIRIADYATSPATVKQDLYAGWRTKQGNYWSDGYPSSTYKGWYPNDYLANGTIDTSKINARFNQAQLKSTRLSNNASGQLWYYTQSGSYRYYYVGTFTPGSEYLTNFASGWSQADVDKSTRDYRSGNSHYIKVAFTNDQRRNNGDNYGNWDEGLGAGYGLVQWTSSNRKRGLYNYAKSTNRKIDDVNMQIEYCIKELKESYKADIYDKLKTVKSVDEASLLIVSKFECPLDTYKDGYKTINVTRSSYGNAVFNHFAAEKDDIQYTREEPCRIWFQTCCGHADLDVAMIVTTLDQEDNTSFFDAAMSVEGLESDTKADHFLWIFTWDGANETIGLGTVDYKAFKPYEDWANKEYQELAKTKADNDIPYEVGNKDVDGADDIKHEYNARANSSTFDAFESATDIYNKKMLLFNFYFNGKKYSTPWFVSGEQKNVPRWDSTAKTYEEKYLSFKLYDNGKIEALLTKQTD